MVSTAKIHSVCNWLIAGAQPPKGIEAVVEDCAHRLNEAGIGLDALIINGLFIHPRIRGIQTRWTRKGGVRRVTFLHEYFDTVDFKKTPIDGSISTKRSIRLRLAEAAKSADNFEAYKRNYKKAGYTDVLVLPLINFDGTVTGCVEFATQARNGFDDEQVTALRRVQSSLARMKEYFTERLDKQITLATYLGEATSQKVLSGKIVRGEGETISAVVLFADIKGYTQLSNSMESQDVLQLLNHFFSVIDDSVSRNNGEILKFLGDGALVIFPTPDDLTAQEAAADGALQAIAQAREAMAHEHATPSPEFRAALHVGDIFYGNIGSRTRLDFTAIGPTINLCSRMLQEASRQNARTICSKQFMDISTIQTGNPVSCEVAGFDETVGFFRSRISDAPRRTTGNRRFQAQPKASLQRPQTPAWAWRPTSGRIFQHRWHFSPSAISKTTPTPSTSGRRNASAGAGSPVTVKPEVMHISSMSIWRSRARTPLSSTCTTGAASRLEPMTLSRRWISSAAVTTRRTRRTLATFASFSRSRHAAGVSGKSTRCTELSSPEYRSSQTSSIVKTRIGDSQVVSRWNRMSSTVRAARRRGLSPSQ
ncbi:adenylate/guanylate cyclase domain-containing protein [Ruegeria sediminis]|uniref:Adenylate/guanylate cyclase domain-containing protein n=1 Tax=Ruegeria sediminis TaxID=2583820 RepID=A0ABY2WYI2_9RHOB|nr:adenylate/guanylate cyclase domain-containing protein [Ruegeria sediminis]